ncbi:polysaccharide deacetylase family protein [Salimicrobium halophilum]|nr:polysaccharide deacetylase family protein [Salimicrobium halophilum]
MTITWRKWKVYIILTFLVLLTFPLLYWSRPPSVPAFANEEDEPRALLRVNTQEPHLALTFNVEWGEDIITETLETLDDYEISATFFVSGEWAERHPNLLEAIHEKNHELGILGYKGHRFSSMENYEIQESLKNTIKVFEKLDFAAPAYLYPPKGAFNAEVLKIADGENLNTVYGSIHPPLGTGSAMAEHILFHADNGDIIHLNATDESKGLPKALNIAVPVLKEQGYEFHTISSLASGMDIEIKKP